MRTKTIFLLLLVLLIFPSIVFSAKITLSWDPVSGTDIVGYRVYAREAGQLFDYNDPETQVNKTKVTLAGFDKYESYYFVVRAVDNYGNESGDSNEVYWDPRGTNDSGDSSTLTSDDNDRFGSGGGASGSCFISNLLGA